MIKNEGPIRKTRMLIIYILTSAAMVYTVYIDLVFAGEGSIWNLELRTLLESWPVLLLLFSCPVLLFGALISVREPWLAARIALVAALPAWMYYLLNFCLFSFALFFRVKGIIGFVLPMVLLGLTTFYSFRVRRWSAR